MAQEHKRGGNTEIGRLIDRIRAGDPNARQELFECAYGRFQAIARRLLNRSDFSDVRDRGVATEEVVHETFVERIFKRNELGHDLFDRQEFRDPKTFVGAVARRMQFCLKDIVLGRGGAAIRQNRQKTNAPSSGGRQIVDKKENPSNSDTEEWALLLTALEQLDEKDQEVVRLRYLVGLSRDEVAAHLGVSTKYVTRNIRQARERLTKILRTANEEG
jgi:RNA polymerase sigma factor (sigma-70 family)